ncbi:glycosyltransferase [Vibrio cholerae]|uniref:glycosyltransferase n=3 Tax=Vibrio cholerae TaxID=666 RepID=UPI0015841D2A|nr:glycosyltransferase [Vibrio cholerae]QKU83287.1 glycosyltransferase [Vibrio cholerae]
MLKASVIVSMYKDVEALNSILYALSKQSISEFEVIIAEDGDDPQVANFLNSMPYTDLQIVHITQEDIGWRKMTAVNKAVAQAKSDYVIFLDGDCIPHFKHVEIHLEQSNKGSVLIGRRVFLGEKYSKLVRQEPNKIGNLQNPLNYLFKIVSLHKDNIRNYEVGLINHLLHKLYKKKYLNLIGCNFSCFVHDFKLVNGYNEELPGVGAEDDDLSHRMMAIGLEMRNIKFLSPVYHLDHPARRSLADVNKEITKKDIENGIYYCKKGIDQYL